MAISENAKKNFVKFFGRKKTLLEETDPEITDVMRDFTYGELYERGKIEDRLRQLIILDALIAVDGMGEFKNQLTAAINMEIPPIEIKEAIYQAIPYVGFGKVSDFIYAANEVMGRKRIKIPLKPQSTTDESTRGNKGLTVQKAIFGDTIDKMYEASPEDQIHIQEYLSANCFGDFYTRKGLGVNERELLTFACLVSLGGCEDQVCGHIRGNLNVGNGKDVLIEAVTQLIPYIGYPRVLNALKCINSIEE